MPRKPEPVEIERKLTHDQIREARMNELEEKVSKLDGDVLELRNAMLLLRKELLPKTTSKKKSKKVDQDQ